MKKDILVRKVTDIAVAALPSEEDENFWDIYFLNLKDEAVKNVLISSRGYGVVDGEKKETSQLRYFFEGVGAEMAVKIEPISSELFKLANEYWISFNFEGFMYDKKYVFVSGSLTESNFITLPIIGRLGVMIK